MSLEMMIDGARFCDYAGFVEEFNRAYALAVGASTSDWNASWDGDITDLHELLEATIEVRGKPLTIHWTNSQKSIFDLGHREMAEFWRQSIESIPAAVFSPASYQLVHGWNQERLDQAETGQGRTLFEYLVWQIRGDGEDLVELKLE
jgi:hypothetical protein